MTLLPENWTGEHLIRTPKIEPPPPIDRRFIDRDRILPQISALAQKGSSKRQISRELKICEKIVGQLCREAKIATVDGRYQHVKQGRA